MGTSRTVRRQAHLEPENFRVPAIFAISLAGPAQLGQSCRIETANLFDLKITRRERLNDPTRWTIEGHRYILHFDETWHQWHFLHYAQKPRRLLRCHRDRRRNN